MGNYTPFVWAIILIVVFGGFLPAVLAPFNTTPEDSESYLLPVKDFITNGITFDLPAIFGGETSINPFKHFSNLQNFWLNQLNGFALIPLIVVIPLILLITTLILFGIRNFIGGT